MNKIYNVEKRSILPANSEDENLGDFRGRKRGGVQRTPQTSSVQNKGDSSYAK